MPTPRARLFWIAGASTAGKTTTVPLLKAILPSDQFATHDFDEVDMPAASSKVWRTKAIRYWLKRARRNAQKGISTVIGGAIFPTEISEELKTLKPVPVSICLLDISAQVLNHRMRQRFQNKTERAKWMRSVGKRLKESLELNIRMAQRYRRECKQCEAKVFRAYKSTPEKVAARVAQWILASRSIPPSNS